MDRAAREVRLGHRVEGRTIRLADSRTVGFADYGSRAATAVLWRHGGPGSRAEPAHLAPQAGRAGLRIVGIDRPGYGLSTPQAGRTIAGRAPDALAVADHLGIGQFVAVGASTGGAFALALAALAPERVLGVVACCSMTDARWPEGRATMSRSAPRRVGRARSRRGPGCGHRRARRGRQQDARRRDGGRKSSPVGS